MIIAFTALLGAAVGAFTARRRNGSLTDSLQYGFVYALAFAVLGLFATILVDRALR